MLLAIRSEIYEALYETVCGDEIRKTLYLTNFSMVNMILWRNVTGDRSGIYEELYETAFVNEFQRTLCLTNFTVLLF